MESSERTVYEKILAADLAGGSDKEKMVRLLSMLNEDDLRALPARWLAEQRRELFWEDNLLALAERVLGLPTKPVDPTGPAMREWESLAESILAARR